MAIDPTRLTARTTAHLDVGWKFRLGDIPSPVPNTHIAAYMANKAGWSRGAAGPRFDDSDWPTVDLPHDWSVAGNFDLTHHLDNGYLPRGTAWYRRYFSLDDSDRGKYLALQFDGVATHCTVYVNGHLLHRNFCGYTPFTINITDVAQFGEQINVVAVHVDATHMEGWWYEGAGIYRHVWLIKTAPLHVAPWGTFVSPRPLAGDQWETGVQTTVENSSDHQETCQIISAIFDPAGRPIAANTSDITAPARSTLTVEQVILTPSPQLWSPQTPHLYRLNTRILRDGQTIDDYATPFGYRTIRFDPDTGFFLNDQPVKLKGTCNHHDHAGVGVALPDSLHRLRIRLLQQMGSNAYRCAHNPPAPELLDTCDELGMLVMDENRNFGSSPRHLEELSAMIRRDRNHPSIILWSLCNEEAVQSTPTGARLAQTMRAAVKKLDPTRPVTAAVSGGILNDDGIASALDVMGINYQLPLLDAFHAKHPRTPILAAETHCSLSTRGVYHTDADQHVFASHDDEKAFWGTTARQAWQYVSTRPFIAGLFAWTGFDYRGEPTPHEWPSINSHWGILDTCGFPKDAFHLHKAFFTDHPFVHLLPHWNWPGKENTPIRVIAYTNCQSVELFLNGHSLGTQPVDPIEMTEWQVPYQPGILKAIGFREGKEQTQTIVETTGPAAALGLEVHQAATSGPIPADGQQALAITAFALDAAGRRIPTAADRVTYSLSGPARILGVGNGDPNCHEPDKASARGLFNGLAQLILQTTTTPGSIVLTASAPHLHPARLELLSTPAPLPLSIPPATPRHLISDWRMSPITAARPDPNQAISSQDMNSWERIDPAAGAQPQWNQRTGFAVYRAAFTPPKILQSTGGRIVFHQLAGAAEAYLDGVAAARKTQPDAAAWEIPFPPATAKITLSVLIVANSFPAGITRPVELLPPTAAHAALPTLPTDR